MTPNSRQKNIRRMNNLFFAKSEEGYYEEIGVKEVMQSTV